jgi:putative transcriptional regulator
MIYLTCFYKHNRNYKPSLKFFSQIWVMIEPASGTLLIANPHLDDPNFLRSVIFLCEHNEEGSFGFVINKKTKFTLSDLIPDVSGFNTPIYEGGPVQLDTLHFLHQYPEKIFGGKEIIDGVYWGGNFEQLVALINSQTIDNSKVRLFLGYSGWSEGQLETEMEEKTWIVAQAMKRFVFHNTPDQIWKDVLKSMGGEYELFVNAPINPRLN